MKCRGREYLRIIYGPEYTAPIRSNVCAPAGSRRSSPSRRANSRSASKAFADSSLASCYAASTNVRSRCSHWKANPLTPDY